MTSPSPTSPGKSAFQVGQWCVDAVAGELRHGAQVRRLRPKAMALLVALAAQPGRLLTRQLLLATVWPEVAVGEASVSVLIAELRHALGDDPRQSEFIETIPRRGYRLVATVSGLEPEPANELERPLRFWLLGDGRDFELRQGDNVIGRASDAQVRIKSPRVSRHHARIVVDGDSVWIEDLGSKNGTFVGAAKIAGPTLLSHGDELRLGQLGATLRVVVADYGSTVTDGYDRSEGSSQPGTPAGAAGRSGHGT